MSSRRFVVACAPALVLFHAQISSGESPYATTVVSYDAGAGAVNGYTDPSVALGPPERMSGEPFFLEAVTPFQPAWLPSEIVSIGTNGSLVLAFDHDVIDDPRNPYGVDLLVFANAFFADGGGGVVDGVFSEGGVIALSLDGVEWSTVPDVEADGAMPTLGYADVEPYATRPGRIETDFTLPVDPVFTPETMVGVDWPTLVAAYNGSGGGVRIDLASVGLERIRYVRITNPLVGISPEIDAIADVAPQGPAADLNGDGVIDATDLAILLGAWGEQGSIADVDGDGVVGASDLAILLGSWT